MVIVWDTLNLNSGIVPLNLNSGIIPLNLNSGIILGLGMLKNDEQRYKFLMGLHRCSFFYSNTISATQQAGSSNDKLLPPTATSGIERISTCAGWPKALWLFISPLM